MFVIGSDNMFFVFCEMLEKVPYMTHVKCFINAPTSVIRVILYSIYVIPFSRKAVIKSKNYRKVQAEQHGSLAAGVPLRVSLAGVCGSPDSTNRCGREVCAGVPW